MTEIVPDKHSLALTRRAFLQILSWAWAAPIVIALRQVTQFLSYQQPGPDSTIVALGTSASLPRLPAQFERARIFLEKDKDGYYALDNVCTHLGCLVHPQADGSFACPCHGSLYTADGSVIRGPAIRPLPYLALRVDSAGQIVVRRGEQVAATFRLAHQ